MRRLERAALALLVAAGLPALVGAQIAGQAATGTPAIPGQTYTNPELHLTFTYPAELTPRDGAFAAAVGKQMVFGATAEQDPNHPVADTCTRVLLAVGKGAESGTWVRVGLVEEGAQCFPAKVLRDKKAMDVLLRNLVTQGTTVMGLMPLEQAAAYEIEGRKANFAAAQGEPVTGNDLQTGAAELIGVAAVAVEGGVLAWVIETNDGAMFNRLLGSGVDFGTGKPQRLFPAELRGSQ